MWHSVMQFKDLIIGQQFRFASEITMPRSGMAKGPWEKFSSNRYIHIDDIDNRGDGGMACRIGSVNVDVMLEND